jgi:capsular exopolysaccharide synthesis family protein
MTFAQFYKALMKRWLIVLICFLLVGAGAYIGSSKFFMKPIYQSTTLIEVAVRAGNSPLLQDNILASVQLAQTESNLVTTTQVLGVVASHYPGLTVDALTKNVTSTVRSNTQLFDITVQDTSPTQAATIANDIAATLIKQQLQLAQQPAADPSFLVVVQSAQPAPLPVRPNKTLNTGAGLLIGLLLGILLAVLLEFLDTRVQTKETLSQSLDWPVLGTIWRFPHNKNSLNNNTDAYSILRANIRFSASEKPFHTLVITSAAPGEGKSIIASNLATTMAKSGKSTLLIDANLRHPTQHEPFDIPPHALGFSNAIVAFKSNTSITTNEPSLMPFMRATDIPNLLIMPSGPLPPNPSELFDSKAMQRFLTALNHGETEVVIFDAPALLGLSDAMLLASQVDSTLLVVDITRARKKDLQQAKDLLEQAGAHVIGSVINKQHQGHKITPYKQVSGKYSARMSSDISQEDTKLIANVSPVEPLTPLPSTAFEPVPSSTPRMVVSSTPRPVSSSASWQSETSLQEKKGANNASIATPYERVSSDNSQDQTLKVTPSQQKKDR